MLKFQQLLLLELLSLSQFSLLLFEEPHLFAVSGALVDRGASKGDPVLMVVGGSGRAGAGVGRPVGGRLEVHREGRVVQDIQVQTFPV